MKVKDILRQKGSAVYTIRPEATVSEAIEELTEKGVGALVVKDDAGQIRGIVTERDILRRCIRKGESTQAPVRAIMTEDVIVGLPDDEIDYVMNVITQNKIRHLPIVSGGELVGIVSIGDAVKAMLKEMEFENRHLRDYIKGGG